MILKQGTLLDATVVESQVRRPSLKAGRGAGNPQDPDAGWASSHWGRRSHFGYKLHLGVDEKSGLIRRAGFTPGNVYESLAADQLISGDEGAVYGDRAYESRSRRQWLQSRGIKDRIMHRSHKHQKQLPHWQQRHNDLISPIRKQVEKVFGTLKRSSETQLWLLSGPVPRTAAQHRRDVVQGHGLQPETG